MPDLDPPTSPRPRRSLPVTDPRLPDKLDADAEHPPKQEPDAEVAASMSEEPSSGSRRSPRQFVMSFLRPTRGQAVLAVILGLTALLVVVTIRSQAARPDYSGVRRADLIQLLDNLTSQTRRLEAEIAELEATRDELASGVQGSEAAQAEAARRLQQLQIIGGTVPVHGRGVRLTITDPAGKVTPELLLDGLEELRDAGAEVVEFNDTVRVVAGTWLALDDQGRIVADGQVLEGPVQIEAIGDPATLEAGARFRGGLVSEVEGPRVGGTVTVEQLERVEIASVAVAEPNVFARPN